MSGIAFQILGLTLIIIMWFWRLAYLLSRIIMLLEEQKDHST